MDSNRKDRREFLRSSLGTAAVAAALAEVAGRTVVTAQEKPKPAAPAGPPRIRFAAIGLNHGHINGQCRAVMRGGGELVSFYAKEPDLAAAFTKEFPQAKLARNEREILEDKSIQLVVSAAIANERAPLGIEVMKHGKDFMSDKPGMTTLEQLAEVKKVQAQTKRIYSILYSERHENRATIKAGELVKAGAIGKVVQTVGLGPHRMNPKTRPEWFFKKAAIRRHPHRHRVAPVRSVPVVHQLDAGGDPGVAGGERQQSAVSGAGGFRRLPAARQRRLGLHPRRLVHARWAQHLG